tara:strand:+ start:115 stop:246 length:132 start_codon:yes stop_codon:yes gene_type:complete
VLLVPQYDILLIRKEKEREKEEKERRREVPRAHTSPIAPSIPF